MTETAYNSLSLVIIAFNEADNLPRLLASVPAGVDVIVVDSHSEDGTGEIAKKFGAKLEHRAFDNYATQKNFAAGLATRDWILSLDADELPSPELWREIATFVAAHPKKDAALKLRRQLVFLGREMRFGKTADAPLRVWPRGKGEFKGAVHEEVVLSPGTTLETSQNHLKHFSYRDLSDYFSRFNRYTTRIALKHQEAGDICPHPVVMALRFPLEFLSRYIVRLGILDGYPGFVYALFSSVYAFVKYAKYLELKAKKS